jgi:polysaccharide export outer membrane protein
MTIFWSRTVVVLIIVFGVCAVFTAPVARAQNSENNLADSYALGPDDVLSIMIYGEKDLSGSYKVGPGGNISVPLIGEVQVGGLTSHAAEDVIENKLADGYLVDPSVSIQVSEARPFYIMGEVKNPGSYKYVSNMTALSAVAMAGGFTYRAKESSVKISRGGAEEKIATTDKILPGDVITVDERFF